jgi:sugar lactone lactonase YvrE
VRAVLFALLVVGSIVAPAAAAGTAVPAVAQEPVVRTLAGSGQDGTDDGPAAGASFREPDGIAVAPDGTIYVADGTANDIRAITDGTVRALAGSSKSLAGFEDGPAATALFNRPVGVAVAKDGTIYVADSLNRRIRRIAGGLVTTFAGSGVAGKTDGPGVAASFNFPKGVAVDDDGNVYVADFADGIRKIAPNGMVTTMNVPTTGKVFSVAARGGGTALILDYTDDQGIHTISGGNHRGLPVGAEREPFSENNHVGNAFGIAIVDANSVAITDLWTNAVRYVNFNDPPLRPAPKTRTLAGGKRDGAFVIGGYRDGSSEVAMVKSPYGLAYTPDGRIIVADSGNRRIREISGLNPRLPIASDLSNFSFPAHAYRIVLIANSLDWNNVLWPESMGGVLESGLGERQAVLGTTLRPSVLVLSVSAGTLHSSSDFIRKNLSDGQADLVILEYDRSSLAHEMGLEPALGDDRWKSVLPQRLAQLATQLQKHGTKLALLLLPRPRDVSPVENGAIRENSNGPDAYDTAGNYRSAEEFEDIFAGAHLHTIRLLQPLVALDRRRETTPLYNTFDVHFTVAGSIFVGRAILADILAWKPWLSVKPRP